MRCAQEKILYGVLGVGAVVLLFPYLLGVVLAGQIGLWSVVVIDSWLTSGCCFLSVTGPFPIVPGSMACCF